MAKKPAAPKPSDYPKPDASVDPQLKQEVHEAVKEAKQDVSDSPPAYQGHDRRP